VNVRGLLRYEIWSNRTTRRVLGPVWKFLKLAAIAWVVTAVLAGLVVAFEFYWLTGGERRAGTAALVSIEQLEGLIDCDCAQFLTDYGVAKAKVDLAKQEAWTFRDHLVVTNLEFYLFEAGSFRADDQRRAQMQMRWHTNPALVQKYAQEDLSFRRGTFNRLRSELHKELD
jgi:hypothetical protein